MRALVVGGGVFGLTGAIELAARGWQVEVLDPGPIPHPLAASTDISKFIRADYGSDAFYASLMVDALEGWERWNEELGPLYRQTGLLVLSGGPMVPGGFEHDSYHDLVGRGWDVERLDAQAIREQFPAWNTDLYPQGYFNRRAGWANSGAVIEALADLALDRHVELREGVRVLEILGDGRRLRTDRGDLEADVVVVAAGAWTPKLVPWLVGAMRATGHPVLHFRADPVTFSAPAFPAWAADIGNTGWYGFPARPDGTLKIANHGAGLAVEADGSRDPAPGTELRFQDHIARALPSLVGAPPIYRRLCLYCDTFDGDLWIDRDPDRDGLVVAAGGSGHGFKFAPVLGAIIADAVEGKDSPWRDRFCWRGVGERRFESARNA